MNESASSGWIVRLIVIGAVAVALLWAFAYLLGVFLKPMAGLAEAARCRQNLGRIVRAFQMYADDYDDRFAPSAAWSRSVTPYLDSDRRLHCPTASRGNMGIFGYAMNSELSEKKRADVINPGTTPLVYDSASLNADASDKSSSQPKPGRHRSKTSRGAPLTFGNDVGYVGGAARFVPDSRNVNGTQNPRNIHANP